MRRRAFIKLGAVAAAVPWLPEWIAKLLPQPAVVDLSEFWDTTTAGAEGKPIQMQDILDAVDTLRDAGPFGVKQAGSIEFTMSPYVNHPTFIQVGDNVRVTMPGGGTYEMECTLVRMTDGPTELISMDAELRPVSPEFSLGYEVVRTTEDHLDEAAHDALAKDIDAKLMDLID